MQRNVEKWSWSWVGKVIPEYVPNKTTNLSGQIHLIREATAKTLRDIAEAIEKGHVDVTLKAIELGHGKMGGENIVIATLHFEEVMLLGSRKQE